jgi:hypothetical protein
MIVAVRAVLMMQVIADQVVGVVPVWNGLVATT